MIQSLINRVSLFPDLQSSFDRDLRSSLENLKSQRLGRGIRLFEVNFRQLKRSFLSRMSSYRQAKKALSSFCPKFIFCQGKAILNDTNDMSVKKDRDHATLFWNYTSKFSLMTFVLLKSTSLKAFREDSCLRNPKLFI